MNKPASAAPLLSTQSMPGLTEEELEALEIGERSQNIAICPKGGFLSRTVGYFETVSEAPSAAILGSLLPVFSACLSQKVTMKPNIWAGLKLTLYSLVAGSPGTGKSTLIHAEDRFAREILDKVRFGTMHTSEEAMFDAMDPEKGGCPDKLFIISEGNEVINRWSQKNSVGSGVGKKMLTLHDATAWSMSYRKDSEGDQPSTRVIEIASANLVMGTTMNTASFNQVSDRDGLRRRFLVFIIKDSARIILYPQGGGGSPELQRLCLDASVLNQISGEVDMDKSARGEWERIQYANREKLRKINSREMTELGAIEATLVSTEPSNIMKVAVIFACCEKVDCYVNRDYISHNSHKSQGVSVEDMPSRSAPTLTSKHIKYAEKFVKQCTYNALQLDRLSDGSRLNEDCEEVAAKVYEKYESYLHYEEDGLFNVELTKTELTRLISSHGKRSRITTDRLNNVILPEMDRRAKCHIDGVEGEITRKVTFIFTDLPRGYIG